MTSRESFIAITAPPRCACPPGYYAVGVGYNGFGLEPYETFMQFSAAGACFTNDWSFDRNAYVFATCLRQQVD